ncbi:MAG: hypothetical protein VKQ33_14195 [Candidatus Sericytochromatia bacterium]|nr:hypothetical protein [Candidatus Sericytochromatia bacterium]
MKRNAPFLGVLLASSLTLATLAGCQAAAPTVAGEATAKAGNQTAAPAKPAGGQTETPQANPANPGSPAGASAEAGSRDATTAAGDLAAMLAAEREAEDYNAVAGDEDQAAYRLFDLDEKGKPRIAREGEMVTTAMPGDDGPEARGPRPDGKAPMMDPKAPMPGAKPPKMDPKAREALKEQLKKAREAAKARAEEGRKKYEARARDEEAKAFKGKLAAVAKAALEKREKERKEKAKDRLAKAKGNMDKAREALKNVEWVDNGDGTRSKTFTFDVSRTENGETISRSRKIVRTVRAEDNVLVSLTAEFTNARPNGGSTTTSRAKTLQPDGTYRVVFHSVIVLGDGTTRTADWEKTIAADGTVAGSGKIVWERDGAVVKTVDIQLGGTEANETAKVEVGEATAEVAVPADGEPSASITNEDGQTAPVAVAAETDGTVEVQDETAEQAEEPASPAEEEQPAQG